MKRFWNFLKWFGVGLLGVLSILITATGIIILGLLALEKYFLIAVIIVSIIYITMLIGIFAWDLSEKDVK